MTSKKLNPMPKDLLFALDIGTRNVVGTIARQEGDNYVVLDYEVMSHPERAMFDGQIHDIEKVTKVVSNVVEALEKRNGFGLERAAIAAAGRALKIERASVSREIDLTKEMTKMMTDSLEMEAIQAAQKKLTTAQKVQSDYYCVGYSVINYYLDGSMILNPLGHKGSEIEVEIIATFLPHIVVDSLYAVINRAGLEVMNLTLEPIAAMSVAIPPHLRLLNLALVDVGAGTSDIAISKEGTVVSYGMVAYAGDKVTEQLAQTYLLDFNMAEALKVELNQRDKHCFNDILGLPHEVTTDEILTQVESTVLDLAEKVGAHILELNKKAPSAVFCIGGGSQIPEFTELLARKLELPPERVVIKTVESLEKMSFVGSPLKGPEFITPIGIGVTAFTEREQDFLQVNVNDNTVRLFNSKSLRVADALILAGIPARSLLSERGPELQFTLNGNQQFIKGEYGEPAQIFVNGVLSSLDGKLSHKDQITVVPALPGNLKQVCLSEVISTEETLDFKGQKIQMHLYVSVNGVNRTGEYIIKPEDEIVTKGIHTLLDLAQLSEINPRTAQFTVNGEERPLSYVLKANDVVDFSVVEGQVDWDEAIDFETEDNHDAFWNVEFDPLEEGDEEDLQKERGHNREKTQKEPLEAKNTVNEIEVDKTSEESLIVTVNGEELIIPQEKKSMIFVDIFNFIDFDISQPKGILVLKLNGERARYTDILKTGDVIELKWK